MGVVLQSFYFSVAAMLLCFGFDILLLFLNYFCSNGVCHRIVTTHSLPDSRRLEAASSHSSTQRYGQCVFEKKEKKRYVTDIQNPFGRLKNGSVGAFFP